MSAINAVERIVGLQLMRSFCRNAKTMFLNDFKKFGQGEISKEHNSTESAQYDSLFS